ncbi:50S ribosomal protein L20 [Williamsoniiplasma somnilux]|uniref:Large ribosomal subunit protein bL20 n=1 Tax=Williamsoniiplasma somnilux TaxID=215578 RepID=A0A2K8NYJ0_9MOLU|nr:50S ribosomal protein L20 [Williamsoniiplasma somnilux]
MARVKFGKVTRARRKRWIKRAKGYYGLKKSSYKKAHEQVVRSMAYAFVGRKQKKRDFRQLWIVRINAAVRPFGLSYSKFMNGLKLSGIEINRKMLSELAISQPSEFEKIVNAVQKALNSPITKSTAKPLVAPVKKEVEVKAEAPKKNIKETTKEIIKDEVDSHDFLKAMEAKYAANLEEEAKHEAAEKAKHEAALAAAKDEAEKVAIKAAQEAKKAEKAAKLAAMSTEERAKLDGSDSITEARSELQKHANKIRSLAPKENKKVAEANLRDMTKKELIKYMKDIRDLLKK